MLQWLSQLGEKVIFCEGFCLLRDGVFFFILHVNL